MTTKKEKNEEKKMRSINVENSNEFHQIYYSLQLLFNVIRINKAGKVSKRLSKLERQQHNNRYKQIVCNETKSEQKKWHGTTTMPTPITITVKIRRLLHI